MYRQKFLGKLKFLNNLYIDRLYQNKDAYLAYLTLLNINDIYRYMTGYVLFDEFKFKKECPIIYENVRFLYEFDVDNSTEMASTFNDFTIKESPFILSYIDNNRESLIEEIVFDKEIKKEEIKPLVNEFLKYECVEDKDIFNKFCSGYRIIKGIPREDLSGEFLADYIGNNDYIYISNFERDNNFYAMVVAHEIGHALDVCKLDKNIKSKYSIISPYGEVISSYYENKFYDFLIDHNIIKNEARFYKSELISDIFDNFNTCITSLDCKRDDDIEISTVYGYGKLLGIYLSNSNSEVFNDFMKLHYKIYDSTLLEKLDFNKDKAIKVLSKEFNKISK